VLTSCGRRRAPKTLPSQAASRGEAVFGEGPQFERYEGDSRPGFCREPIVGAGVGSLLKDDGAAEVGEKEGDAQAT